MTLGPFAASEACSNKRRDTKVRTTAFIREEVIVRYGRQGMPMLEQVRCNLQALAVRPIGTSTSFAKETKKVLLQMSPCASAYSKVKLTQDDIASKGFVLVVR